MINKIREHKQISVIVMIVLFIMLLPLAFSKYKSNTNIKVKTITGEIVYDLSIEENNKYIEKDNTYIFININNFKITDNIKYINNVDYDYDLIITGKDLEFSLDNNEYKDKLIYNNSFSKEELSNKVKVYIKNNYSNNHDIKVELKASQKDMEGIK